MAASGLHLQASEDVDGISAVQRVVRSYSATISHVSKCKKKAPRTTANNARYCMKESSKRCPAPVLPTTQPCLSFDLSLPGCKHSLSHCPIVLPPHCSHPVLDVRIW